MGTPLRQLPSIVTAALTVALLAAAYPLRGAEPQADSARETWMPGYLKLEQATMAVREKKLTLALTLYEEANS